MQYSKVDIFLVACQWKDYAFKYRWESEELKEMKRISKQTNREDGMVKKNNVWKNNGNNNQRF